MRRSGILLGLETSVHFTETCAEQAPHLITQVTTTDGAVTDDTALADIQEGLSRQELLPQQQIVDTSYVDAQRHGHEPDTLQGGLGRAYPRRSQMAEPSTDGV